MSNRGPSRENFKQAAQSSPDQHLPAWWVLADPKSTTVPQPYRPDAFAYRQPPRPARPRAPTSSGPAAQVPPTVRRERIPGGTALDGLDQHDDKGPARSNWRDLFYRVTRINLGPGKDSTYELGLQDRVRTAVGSAFPIAVLNLKGGVGKTTVVEALGSTFADVRDDRIIAVDIDAGDLADRHGRRNPLSMADLLADDAVMRYTDVRAHTYMNSFGLEVLGLPDYARNDWRPERHDVVKAFSILRKHYSVVLVDCVKALKSPLMEAVLPESRALVVVTSTCIDAIRKTRTTLEWLSNNGYQKLIESTILAVNHIDPGKLDAVAGKELERLFTHVAATVVLPFDRHVHEGKEISLDRLSRESRRCYLEMAAALADMFPSRGMEHDFRAGAGVHSQSR
jgi:MinD-like ATPase involved in chromosome partitioning or flagellar assembly